MKNSSSGSSLKAILPPTATGLGIVALWEGYTRGFDIDPLLLPSPTAVLSFLFANLQLFLKHSISTLSVISGGFAMGALCGLSLGVAMHASSLVRRASYPWLVASQMVPIPAIAPILLLWLGFTIWPKLIVVALICFFPVAVNTVDGLRQIDRECIDLLKTFKASKRQLLLFAALPAALPAVFSGFRVAMALAVIAAVFGEWVGARSGLGQLMLAYNNQTRTDGLFAAVGVLATLGIGLFFLVGWLERKLLPWRRLTENSESP
ncbi:MAG: ABC transporter permease [Verrucomicrobiota bacterium]